MNFFGGGNCQTRVPGAEGKVFLTFDDGPNESFTPMLLEFCATRRIQATFFLVADRARKFPELSRALVEAGHTVGNHSLDHRYRHFFHQASHLKTWIDEAQTELTEITGYKPFAFRSPNGIRTPPLREALDKAGLPLVHWSRRFFDTVFPWTETKAARAAARAEAGEIILLHDVPHRDPVSFLRSLDRLVAGLRERGLEPSALRKEHIQP